MTFVGFFGCILLAFAPAFSVFLLVISRNAQLIILSIGGSFFWLLSALLAAIWWYIIPPLRTAYPWIIICSIIFQEALRFGFFSLYVRAEKGFIAERERQTASLTSHPDPLRANIAIGWGAGVAHSLVSYVTLLWEYSGPASYFSHNCSVSIFIVMAVQSFCFIVLHMLWSIIGYEGFVSRNPIKMSVVVLTHLCASFLTMLNMASCGAGMSMVVILTLGVSAYTFYVCRGSRVYHVSCLPCFNCTEERQK
ncbi:hypothetical protein PROFUN_00257 [Planoprotostelium fungivorum]|uniref:Gamma-secretase subunit Aph-1 n=1 Tax=Planoprotostelium fungivorum TaxID=1890364 RepID=A0A2P6NXW4_9EUKA|nr:hypothetical protein PROFUN_00257 [Planoprotostelium fungivorum]